MLNIPGASPTPRRQRTTQQRSLVAMAMSAGVEQPSPEPPWAPAEKCILGHFTSKRCVSQWHHSMGPPAPAQESSLHRRRLHLWEVIQARLNSTIIDLGCRFLPLEASFRCHQLTTPSLTISYRQPNDSVWTSNSKIYRWVHCLTASHLLCKLTFCSLTARCCWS